MNARNPLASTKQKNSNIPSAIRLPRIRGRDLTIIIAATALNRGMANIETGAVTKPKSRGMSRQPKAMKMTFLFPPETSSSDMLPSVPYGAGLLELIVLWVLPESLCPNGLIRLTT